MFLPCYAPIRLADKIDAWRQEVVTQSQELQETPGDETCNAQSSHGMNLRSSTSHAANSHSLRDQGHRPALAKISDPNRSRRKISILTSSKRKPSILTSANRNRGATQVTQFGTPDGISQPKLVKTSLLTSTTERRRKAAIRRAMRAKMPLKENSSNGKGRADDPEEDYVPEEHTEPTKRGRGRPLGSKNRPKPDTGAIESGMSSVALNDTLGGESRGGSTQSRKNSRSRNASRSRAASLGPGGDRKTGDIAVEYLRLCRPPVYLKSKNEIIQLGIPVPDEVKKLWDSLAAVPSGATIPFALQAKYIQHTATASPWKLQEPPLDHEYMSPDRDPWPAMRHDNMMARIDRILRDAKFSLNGPECQWGDIVVRVLNAFDLWPEGETIRSINL
ncbi:MAG: hypothetical protein Q9218_002999 [Villophora microphyllina]